MIITSIAACPFIDVRKTDLFSPTRFVRLSRTSSGSFTSNSYMSLFYTLQVNGLKITEITIQSPQKDKKQIKITFYEV